jgi:hypothetical protein
MIYRTYTGNITSRINHTVEPSKLVINILTLLTPLPTPLLNPPLTALLTTLSLPLLYPSDESKMDVTEGAVESKKRFKKFELAVVSEVFGLTREMMKAGMCYAFPYLNCCIWRRTGCDNN